MRLTDAAVAHDAEHGMYSRRLLAQEVQWSRKRIADLEAENRDLQRKVADLQRKVADLRRVRGSLWRRALDRNREDA